MPQVPRGTQFVGDVVAGAVIGLVTERVGSQLAAAAGSTLHLAGDAPSRGALLPTSPPLTQVK